MKVKLMLASSVLFVLSAGPALANDQGYTHTTWVNVASKTTKANGSGSSKAATFRRRKAVEAGMKKARTKLLNLCKKNHANDAACKKACKAKKYRSGGAAYKDIAYQRTCKFYSGKPKHVEECQKLKNPAVETIVARAKCACKCSKYYGPK